MSFILQVFHAPEARTLDAAVAAVDALEGMTREDRLRFIRFITALTERFPNDLDDEDAPFPEGLAADHLDDPVYVFLVNLDRLDDELMLHIAECARAADLHVLDPQNALFYRSDGWVVRPDGTLARLPGARRVIPKAASQPLPKDMTVAECVRPLDAALCERLAPIGFAPDARWGQARRMVGAVEQAAEVIAYPRENEVALHGSLGLRCRPITGVWLRALGADGARLVRELSADGWRFPDFRVLLSGLPGEADHETAKLGGFTYATDWSGSMAWLERWAAWVESQGSQHLARMDRPAGIARYLLGEKELQLMARRTDLQPGEILHRIVLAGAYAGPARDEWLAALRRYCEHHGRNYEKEEAPVRVVGFQALAERLISWLDTPEFAAQAQRLRELD